MVELVFGGEWRLGYCGGFVSSGSVGGFVIVFVLKVGEADKVKERFS